MESSRARLVAKEVSLAAYPKNKRKFLIVMEDSKMGELEKFIATLVAKADVPVIVKEELKGVDTLNDEQCVAFVNKMFPYDTVEYDDKVAGLESQIVNLKTDLLSVKFENKIGKELSEKIMRFYGKLSELELEELANDMSKLEEAANGAGKAVGNSDVNLDDVNFSDISDIDSYVETVKKNAGGK